MVKKYIVALSEEERQSLEQLTTTGQHTAYQMTYARILLKADRGGVLNLLFSSKLINQTRNG